MTRDEIEQYLKDKDLNTFEYQLAMDAMLFAEQKTINRACEWLESTDIDMEYWNSEDGVCKELLIEDIKKAMEK